MTSIRQHFSKPSLEAVQLVAVLGSNQTHLYESLQDYIRTVRLEEAKRMLETTGELFETIAQTCGFGSSHTFYSLFNEHYRISPVFSPPLSMPKKAGYEAIKKF